MGAVSLLESGTVRIWKGSVGLLSCLSGEKKKGNNTRKSSARQDGYALKQKLSCPPKRLYFPFPHLSVRRLPCL